MSEAALPADEAPAAPVRRRRLAGWRRWLLAALLGTIGLLAIGLVVLESPIGHRFIVDRIARYAPASGLKVEIGRFEGSLLGEATLHDLTLSDPKGVFLRVPVAELDWRPFRWFTSGLDVRRLILRRGTLYRAPQFNPGDPDAPLLPNFDIRVDRFELDRLMVEQGMLGPEAAGRRRVDLVAQADIRKGRVYLATNARLGGTDRLELLLDSEPRRDRFALQLDYNAPKGGLLATLAGASDSLSARIAGAGRYRDWRGTARVDQPGANLVDLVIGNRSGRYNLAGAIHPRGFVSGLAARATGQTVTLKGEGTLANSILTGQFGATGQGFDLAALGTLDLGKNAARNLKITARTRDPGLLGAGTRIENARLAATLDGPFRQLSIDHRLTVERFASGTFRLEGLAQQAKFTRADSRWRFPLALTARRIVTGASMFDARPASGQVRGTIMLSGPRAFSDDLIVSVPGLGLGAVLKLTGDTGKGDFRLAGPVAARGLPLADLGVVDADLGLNLDFGNRPWLLSADAKGRMVRVTNGTLTTLAGSNIRFAGHIGMGGQAPLLLQRVTLTGSKLALAIDGRRLPNGTTTLGGRGSHVDYGPFTVEANLANDGPHAVVVLANPLPAAGLKDVRVALAPIPQGFRIEAAGQSHLGPFTGTLGLFAPPGGPTRIVVEQMEVWKTAITGEILLGDAGANGTLALTGGGVDGTIKLQPRGGGQGFEVALTADNARFGGDMPLAIGVGRIDASGTAAGGRTAISGNAYAEGIEQGRLFIGRLAASARLNDGAGRVTATLAGRRGSRFNLQLLADIAPDRYALLANGDYAGQRITMPRRAVLTRTEAGWNLAPTQVDYGGGRLIGQGTLGPDTRIKLAMSDMPLALIDIYATDLGLGGKASGIVNWRTVKGGIPTADAQLQVKGLTRSGLVLTSLPVDVALVARLGETTLETRAVFREGGAEGNRVLGRLQGRVEGLPGTGSVGERLGAGRLFSQLRYSGPADALWRLLGIETFDLTGPVEVAADMTGKLADPAIRGSLASTRLRLQSSLTGTDIEEISVRGNFAGSRLELANFAGRARGGGQVSGSGSVDLAGLGAGRGPSLDFRIAARNAALISRDDMAATVTGPLRIVSNGVGGTIAGRLTIESAKWNLGRAAAVTELPIVNTREINPRADVAPVRRPAAPWRFLVDAEGPNRVAVRGLGLDSEWGANIRIRGTTSAPAIFGRAEMVRGSYDFAGQRFDLTRGLITFDGDSPPDPRLDIAATAQVTGLTASVTVTGTATYPDIRFSSTPALPEEELLSRLLFGSSITQISAPEAVQIGAALAALRGGGGMDPINQLRTAVGLDRLRIVGADVATGRGTSVAVGKYIGRRLYAEIVTDGRGYNATQLEYRVTRWLSVLATVSSIGRQGIDAKISKDY
ncbi:MAG: translocation/assembly module TamB [Sphingomonadales bacterium]|nr:translocation/assembly module TamB [Sphingomonadales bacterium]